MKRFRVLLMMTALLGSAMMANAQEPQDYPASPPLPRELDALEQAARQAYDNPESNGPSWYVQAAEQTAAAWQRLRELCQTRMGQTMGCCEAPVTPGVCKDAAGCAGAAAGCGKAIRVQITGNMEGCPVELRDILMKLQPIAQPPCCGLKGFIQLPCPFAAAQATPPCSCAKGCGCCDTCKAKGANPAQAQAPMLPPSPALPWGMPPQIPWGAPAQAWAPFPQAMPAPRMVIAMTTSVQQTKPAHLVTPDLEAHCQRIIHKDGHIILEGNVLLLCKKNAQPIRIEASRVVVNMNDGSFVVESGAPTVTTHSFGVLRPDLPLRPAMAVPAVPTSRIITVVPVPPERAPR